ncbi:ATP-binding protein [Micromonospora sp. SH-82]|uniref:ATP-binding protein n=1 Tax=Micromonospora sp. SH-82 TaxID=3132938 RepID=UPI003EC11C73
MGTDGSTTVVPLTGTLDAADIATVRDILLTCLWERAGPTVIDLSGLASIVPAARGMFANLDREVADWPGTELAILDPNRVTCPPGTTAPPDGPAVHPTLTSALTALGATFRPRSVGLSLAPVVGAAREARTLVTENCVRWGLPELVEPGCIAITEMVNNAVAHARTGMSLRLASRADALHVAVRDQSHRQPSFTGLAPPTSTGGRGMLLIDTVARRWGSTDVPAGKVVWCVLYAEDEAAFLR